jgi:hypothetical protein
MNCWKVQLFSDRPDLLLFLLSYLLIEKSAKAMGTIVRAICKCGLESEDIYQGIGFAFQTEEEFCEAAYCDNCGIIAGKDGRKLTPKCPKCRKNMTFYNDVLNKGRTTSNFELACSNYLEKRKYWHCPSCKKRTLIFETRGLWD